MALVLPSLVAAGCASILDMDSFPGPGEPGDDGSVGADSALAESGGGDVAPDSSVEDVEPDAVTEETQDASMVDAAETTPGTDATDGGTDAGVDSGPPPVVTCTKAPVFSTAIRVNHHPDSLRRVQTAGMALLEDDRILVAMLEALDTGTRHAVFARIVDPVTKTALPDERLDVDADNLTSASTLHIFAIAGGAIGLRYGDTHLRVYSGGKWSPDIATSFAIAGTLRYLAAPNGDVLVTRARATAPYGEAVVYRPSSGAWWSPLVLDLAGASTEPRIDLRGTSEGGFATLVWQGAGGPSVRTRSLGGLWSGPSAKADIAPSDAQFAHEGLADGSIVLVARETQTADTLRVVTSTWTAAGGWTTSRLLSKPTATTNGVMPSSGDPVLYRVGENELEFVAWVSPCTTTASTCTFEAVTRRYVSGAWQDPVPLGVGPSSTGSTGLLVQDVAGNPLVVRKSAAGTRIDLRMRFDATGFKPPVSLLANTTYFAGYQSTALFYGTSQNLWALVRRDPITDAGTAPPVVALMGRVDQAGAVSWGPIMAGSYELRTLDQISPYADGSAGFTVGANNATNGTAFAAVIAHAGPAGGTPEAATSQTQEESGVSFVASPRNAPRPGRDRSALYMVSANYTPVDDAGVPGVRLRAQGYNGVGTRVAKILALSDKAPRQFGNNGLLTYGCGGAVLYAIDPADGSHALELVFLSEP